MNELCRKILILPGLFRSKEVNCNSVLYVIEVVIADPGDIILVSVMSFTV